MSVLVIGAGLAGCVAAMELSRASADVVVVESSRRPMDGASRHNEGKLHLGYVYAKDSQGRTVALMQQGAQAFAPILRRHLPNGLAPVRVSRPFDYVVHPQSQMPAAELLRCYQAVEAQLACHGLHLGNTDCLGQARVQRPHWRDAAALQTLGLSAWGGQAAYATEERALEPFGLADEVAQALLACPVEWRGGVTVQAVTQRNGAYWAHTSAGQMGPFEAVVNAAWGSRQAIDHSMGLESGDIWNYRYKYFLRVHKPGIGRQLPNLTWAVGPFGDVVTYGDDLAYLSWYPAGRVAWRSGEPPEVLPSAPAAEPALRLKKAILSGLTALLPALGQLDPLRDDIAVFGGLIVGNGHTDIDDTDSGLHRRDNIGVVSTGDYHSVSTGKLTTAPQMGERAAARVLAGVQA